MTGRAEGGARAELNGIDHAGPQPGPGTAVASVSFVSGEAYARHADGTASTPEPGSRVFVGDSLETAFGSGIAVVLADGTRATLGGDARLALTAFGLDPAADQELVRLSLLSGAAAIVSGNTARTGPETMAVDTPVAVVTLRDARIRMGIDGDGALEVVLPGGAGGRVGEVVVANDAGAVILNHGLEVAHVAGAGVAPAAACFGAFADLQPFPWHLDGEDLAAEDLEEELPGLEVASGPEGGAAAFGDVLRVLADAYDGPAAPLPSALGLNRLPDRDPAGDGAAPTVPDHPPAQDLPAADKTATVGNGGDGSIGDGGSPLLARMTIGFVSEQAGYRNSFGWYDTETLEAGLLVDNVDIKTNPDLGAFSAELEFGVDRLPTIGFFLIPNGFTLNRQKGEPFAAGYPGDLTLRVVEGADGWSIVDTSTGFVFQGRGAPALFSEAAKNPGGLEHVRVIGDGSGVGSYVVRWEDQASGGDLDFDDAVFRIGSTLDGDFAADGDGWFLGGAGSGDGVDIGTSAPGEVPVALGSGAGASYSVSEPPTAVPIASSPEHLVTA